MPHFFYLIFVPRVTGKNLISIQLFVQYLSIIKPVPPGKIRINTICFIISEITLIDKSYPMKYNQGKLPGALRKQWIKKKM